jgi:hypothetical protein
LSGTIKGWANNIISRRWILCCYAIGGELGICSQFFDSDATSFQNCKTRYKNNTNNIKQPRTEVQFKVSINLQSPRLIVVIIVDSHRFVDAEQSHTVHPIELGNHARQPNGNVDQTQQLVVVAEVAGQVTQNGRNDEQRRLLVRPIDVRVADYLFPRRHAVHLALLIKVRRTLDPMQVHHGYKSMGAVADSPRHRKGNKGQNCRLKDKYHQQVRQKEDGGGRIDPISVAIAGQLEGEEITGRATGAVQARVGAGDIGWMRVDSGAVRVERCQAGGVGSMAVSRIEAGSVASGGTGRRPSAAACAWHSILIFRGRAP